MKIKTIKIKKAKNGEFFLTLHAENGRQLIKTSETHKNKWYVKKMAGSPVWKAFGVTVIVDETK